MTVTIELDPQDQDRVLVLGDYRDEYLMQQLPGIRHDRSRSQPGTVAHTVPRTWATWMAIQGIFQDQLPDIGPEYQAWLQNDWQTRVQPCLQLRGQTDVLQDPRTPWDERLYPFQRAGVAFLALAGQALLADEMGTGKTVQSICALRRLHDYGAEVFPTLCVVPNSTKGQWKRHWEEWFPGTRVSVVGGSATERAQALAEDADVYVIHWEGVVLHSRVSGFGSIRLLRCGDHKNGDPKLKVSRCEIHEKELNKIPFKSVIVDEAHFMKNPESKRTRAVWSVLRGEKIRYCYALTGTPIGDTPDQLWPIMHGLHPLEYPTSSSYVERYCLQSWMYTGELTIVGINPNTRAEFFGFFDPRFRRMPQALVLPFLPSVVYESRDAVMTPKQATAYKQMKTKSMAELNDGTKLLTADHGFARYTRLGQFASAMCEIDDKGQVRLTKPSPKVNVMMEVFEEAVGRQIAVAAESKQLIQLASDRLTEEKVPHHCLVGGLSDHVRDLILEDFEAGRVRAILFTMQAGGTGLNLTAASVMVRLQRSWSMFTNLQTQYRFRRIGSERHDSLTLVDLVAPKTIEEDQFRRYGEKLARLEEINRDKVTLRQAGRLAELAALEHEEHGIVHSTLLPE